MEQTINEVSVNQKQLDEVTERIVRNEVYSCVSSLVYDLMQDEKYMDELLEVSTKNAYECSSCGYVSSDEDELDDCCDTATAGDTEKNENFIEALEHWIVSPWLKRKLDENGEMTMTFKGLNLWGRTTSGQQISADSVIETIAKGTL